MTKPKEVQELFNKLKINPRNPSKVTEDKIKEVMKSVEGFVEMLEYRPIVYDKDFMVLGGNKRLIALQRLYEAKKIKLKPEYFRDASKLTKKHQKQFIIKDNILVHDEWVTEIMVEDWADEPLDEWGVDTSSWRDEETIEDEAPPLPEKPTSKLGEIYELGRHRLMCGDSTLIEDVHKLMNGQKADMVFTDPPYGVDYQSNKRTKTDKFDVLQNDDVMLTEWVSPALAVSDGWFLFCTTWKVLQEWLDIGKDIGKLSNMIIWNKGGGGIGDLEGTLVTDYEIILAYNRGNKVIGKRLGSVWDILKDSAGSYEHATQKPVQLPATAIKTLSTGSVLDLFGGSGSTLIACEQLDRTCYMMELDPKYCDVIRERYDNFKKEN